jgi:hypothetical protein
MSKQCPVCQAKAVERIDNNLRFKPPSHHCTKCGAKLKTAITPNVLWVIPVGVLSMGVAICCIRWLQNSQIITGTLRAGLIGGIYAFATAVTFNVLVRGMVFRPWSP